MPMSGVISRSQKPAFSVVAPAVCCANAPLPNCAALPKAALPVRNCLRFTKPPDSLHFEHYYAIGGDAVVKLSWNMSASGKDIPALGKPFTGLPVRFFRHRTNACRIDPAIV